MDEASLFNSVGHETKVNLRCIGDEERAARCDEWDALVSNNAAGGIMQTYAWSRFKQRQGLHLLHFGLFEDNKLIGGVIFYCIPQNFGTGILVAPEGPILPWSDQCMTADGLKLIMDAAAEYARNHGLVAMRVEPRLAPPQNRVFREFGRAPYDLIPQETLQLDLSASEEVLLQRMKSKGRYNIRVAERHAVRVEESAQSEAVYKFYPLVKEASLRDGFALEPLNFFEQLSEELVPRGQASFFCQARKRHYRFVVARYLRRTCYISLRWHIKPKATANGRIRVAVGGDQSSETKRLLYL